MSIPRIIGTPEEGKRNLYNGVRICPYPSPNAGKLPRTPAPEPVPSAANQQPSRPRPWVPRNCDNSNQKNPGETRGLSCGLVEDKCDPALFLWPPSAESRMSCREDLIRLDSSTGHIYTLYQLDFTRIGTTVMFC